MISCSAVPERVGVVAAAQPAVAGDDQHAGPAGVRAGVSSGWSSADVVASAVSTLVIASAYGRDAATRAWALAIRLVATSSIALVIFLIDLVDAIASRSTRTCPPMGPQLFGGSDGRRTVTLTASDGLVLHAPPLPARSTTPSCRQRRRSSA